MPLEPEPTSDWTAFLYVAGELSAAEAAAFELRLADDQPPARPWPRPSGWPGPWPRRAGSGPARLPHVRAAGVLAWSAGGGRPRPRWPRNLTGRSARPPDAEGGRTAWSGLRARPEPTGPVDAGRVTGRPAGEAAACRPRFPGRPGAPLVDPDGRRPAPRRPPPRGELSLRSSRPPGPLLALAAPALAGDGDTEKDKTPGPLPSGSPPRAAPPSARPRRWRSSATNTRAGVVLGVLRPRNPGEYRKAVGELSGWPVSWPSSRRGTPAVRVRAGCLEGQIARRVPRRPARRVPRPRNP